MYGRVVFMISHISAVFSDEYSSYPVISVRVLLFGEKSLVRKSAPHLYVSFIYLFHMSTVTLKPFCVGAK